MTRTPTPPRVRARPPHRSIFFLRPQHHPDAPSTPPPLSLSFRLQLIYNVPAVFTAPYSDQTSFEQLYFFPKGYKAVTSKA